jgi:calcineurin-like phosphoesterase family protein
MIYFSSDKHLQHKNICRGTSKWGLMQDGTYDESRRSVLRPFDTTEEMDEYIIKETNRVVGPDDILYELGDFAFGDKKEIPALRNKINCKTIHYIVGNHDKVLVSNYSSCFTSISYYGEVRYKKLLFSFCHYPLGSWNEIGRGGINLFGHSHGNYRRPVGRQFDVGIDVRYQPFSIEELYTMALSVPIILVDGHDGDTNYG